MQRHGKGALRFDLRQTLGLLAVFGSAFCFYLATVIIRWAEPVVDIEAPYFVFSRFLLGFLVVLATMVVQKRRLRPKRYSFLFGRAITNAVAVLCFYKTVEVGTVAEANILNMTYPIFVALISWFVLREQRDGMSVGIVAVSMAGIWMVLSPGDLNIRWENLWGVFSGITAALAIVYLNISRRYHDSTTILFFVFGIGSLLIYLFFWESIFWPGGEEFLYLLACSAAGIGGQYLLTHGFYYVTAVEGSIISSTRILLAALIGPLLVTDPPLTLIGWGGALLIFSANVALALRRASLSLQRKEGSNKARV